MIPTAGTARIQGHDVQSDGVAARRVLGFLPEGAPTYPEMSVTAFLRFVAHTEGLSLDAMRRINTMIAEMDFQQRADLPCIGTDRADMVVAGCAILDAILDIWPAEKLGIADRGIREGILRSLMARDGYVL